MSKKIVLYRAVLPSFGGYDHFGYGATKEEAIKECRKSYNLMREAREVEHSHPDFGTWNRACEYFGFNVCRCTSGTHVLEGNEDYV